MSIFRNEQSVARQEVLEAGWTCVDHLRELAPQLGDERLAGEFEALANAKQTLLEQLAESVRQWGELPVLPDRDRETLEELLEWARASLAGEDDAHAVLDHRREAEERLASLIEHYRDLPFEAGERKLLDALLAQARDAAQTLLNLMDSSTRG